MSIILGIFASKDSVKDCCLYKYKPIFEIRFTLFLADIGFMIIINKGD